MTTGQAPKRRRAVDGPGVIGVVSGEISRYVHFWVSMSFLSRPDGSKLHLDPSVSITWQCNQMIKRCLDDDLDWLWIMGDDHAFEPDILARLLAHDVDVVVPVCLLRNAPFYPVSYDYQNDDGQYHPYLEMPEHGLHEIVGAGSAGMLVRRHVLEALPEEPFRTTGPHMNEDLEFCKQAREAGFKIYVDADTSLWHVGTMVVKPHFIDGVLQTRLVIGPDHEMIVKRPAIGSAALVPG